MANFKKLLPACVLISSPAWAGEVTGTGDYTPIKNGTANSICSFSGLQDGEPPFPSTVVQNYGAIVAAMGGLPPAFLRPGATCNGHTGLFS